MKKKITTTLGWVLSICFLLSGVVNAEEMSLKQVDGSYLTYQEKAEATTKDNFARGEHLMDGSCTISKAGIGKIYIYGQTTANHDVDKVEVIVYLDKYNAKTDEWNQIEVFTKESTDTYYVSLGKRLTVERGTYYRLRSDHYVTKGDDFEQTICFTDGIMID